MDNSQSSDSVNSEAPELEVVDFGTEGSIDVTPQQHQPEKVLSFPSEDIDVELQPRHVRHLNETDIEKEKRMLEACAQYECFPDAIEAGVRPECFTVPLYRKLYRGVMDSAQEELELGLFAVRLRMRDSGQFTESEFKELDELDDIRDPDGTDRHVKERISILLEADKKRKMADLSHRMDLAIQDGDLRHVPDVCEELLILSRRSAASSRSKSDFEKLQNRKFDASHPVKQIPAIISLDGTSVIRRGNISTVTAQKGVGKSSTMNAIMKTATSGGRNLGFEGRVSGKLAYLDFEQSLDDFDEALRFRAGATETDQIVAYHLTGYGHVEARKALFSIIENQEDLELLIIDGYADCVSSPNAEEECFEFVSRLLFTAQERNIAILGVLHLNPGSESKSRGHLGSHLERKSETVIQIDESQGVREMWTSKARKKPIYKGKGLRFAWSDEDRGFKELEGTAAEMKMAAKEEEWSRILYDIQSLASS